jgi:phospholipid/cholesterol/gamma-HCH transport system permease protein
VEPTLVKARPIEGIGDGIRILGRWVIIFCQTTGEITFLALHTLRAMVRYRWDFSEICRQCFLIGNRSIGIVTLIAIFTGMVLALQFSVGLGRFGLKIYTGQIVGLAITRELGPVLTALMVAARVGSGIAAELGSMMVTEQVMAIEAMGANPIQKLVVPRAIAMVIAIPILTIFANAVGVLGGMIITMSEANISANFFMNQIWRTVGFDDYIHGITKTVFFAFIIVMIACREGLKTHGGTAGVGRSTTRAVVYSSITIFVVDFFLTKLFILF